MTHTKRGKWSQEGVPHRGWIFEDIEDLGEPSHTCEMCESALVRYVHYLSHPDYPDTLGVGCVCAEHMLEDYVHPREREGLLRSKARNRKRREGGWLRAKWRYSKNGNFWVERHGYTATIWRIDVGSEPKLRVSFVPGKGWRPHGSTQWHATRVEAEAAATGPYKFCISSGEKRYFSKREYSSTGEAARAIGKTVEMLQWFE